MTGSGGGVTAAVWGRGPIPRLRFRPVPSSLGFAFRPVQGKVATARVTDAGEVRGRGWWQGKSRYSEAELAQDSGRPRRTLLWYERLQAGVALLDGGMRKSTEEGMRLEWCRFEFWMELYGNVPGMTW